MSNVWHCFMVGGPDDGKIKQRRDTPPTYLGVQGGTVPYTAVFTCQDSGIVTYVHNDVTVGEAIKDLAIFRYNSKLLLKDVLDLLKGSAVIPRDAGNPHTRLAMIRKIEGQLK